MENFAIFLNEIEFDKDQSYIKKPFIPKKHEIKNKNQIVKGGYRPILVDESQLKNESVTLENQMNLLNSPNLMSHQDMVSYYILIYLNQRFPKHLFQNFNKIETTTECVKSVEFENILTFKNKNILNRLKKLNLKTLFDLVNNFNLNSVPHSARYTLVKWYTAHPNFKLVLFLNEIPTSEQVLKMQSNGQRCVSLIYNKIDTLIMSERDPLSFLLHDLVHAYKMFGNDYLLKSQVGFYKALIKLIENTVANKYLNDLKLNESFLNNFDYLISDMNSHAKHLFFYFKTILINGVKAEFNFDLESKDMLSGESLCKFSEIFETFLNVFEMNEQEKNVARSILVDREEHSKLENDKSFDTFNFILLDEFFIRLYNSEN